MVEGASKQQLVSLKEFKDNFAFPIKYGQDPELWPRSTILLYKYSSNATKKMTTIPEDLWRKVYNIPKVNHAEIIMKNELRNIQEYLKSSNNPETYNGIHSIEVIQSYSPCSVCSKELCDLMVDLNKDINKSKYDTSDATLDMSALSLDEKDKKDKKDRLNKKDEKVAKINFKITFSNFYKHWENMGGLKNLLAKNIELDVLIGDDKWGHFFDVVGLARKTELPEGRKNREEKDIEYFQLLKGK